LIWLIIIEDVIVLLLLLLLLVILLGPMILIPSNNMRILIHAKNPILLSLVILSDLIQLLIVSQTNKLLNNRNNIVVE
jgi:hypothetical protein